MEGDDTDFTDDYGGFEEEDDENFDEEDENFDVSQFIDSDGDTCEVEGRNMDGFPDKEATVSGKVEEEEIDPDQLEETLKKLEEVFCCLPRVLIKRIVCRDDVMGNIEIARQRLQEFQDMGDPQDMFKAPMTSKPPSLSQQLSENGDFEVGKGKAEEESERFQKRNERGRRRRKSKNNRDDNKPQIEQMEVEEQNQWRRNYFGRNEAEQRDGNKFYCAQESMRRGGFTGKPRGGKRGGIRGGPRGGSRGGFSQGQISDQEDRFDVFQDDWSFEYQDFNFMPQPQRGRGNVNNCGRLIDTRPIPRERPQWATGDGPRGKSRGGFVQGQEDYGYDLYQEDNGHVYGDDVFEEDWRFGNQDSNFMPQPRRGFGNVNDRGRSQDAKPIRRGAPQRAAAEGPRGRPRGGFVQDQGEYGYDLYQQAWDTKDQGYRGRVSNFQREDEFEDPWQWDQSGRQPQFAQDQRGGEQPSHGRGKGRRGRGRNKDPVCLIDLEKNSETRRSDDEFDLGHSVDDPSKDCDQGNPVGPGRAENSERDRGGMTRAQSMPSVEVDRSVDVRETEADESRLEQNKLMVCGLNEMTTDEGVLNFIEAMSGEEVMEVSWVGKSKVLVTMVDRIKDFDKLKTKGERRGLDSAQVCIERVPVCTSILVRGLSDNTTHDAIELYFESQRNSGGPVAKVQFQPNSGRAVVVFQDPTDMEKVLARQQERPHVLNNAELSLRTYHEFLEDDNKDDSDSAAAAGDCADKEPVIQRSGYKAQPLHMAVDPDVMEYVISTSHHDQLMKALALKNSEINWKPNNKMAVIAYRGEDKSDSWQSECLDEVQIYLGKFMTRVVQVKKEFWEAVKTQLSNIRTWLGDDPPLVKPIDDSFVLKVVSLSSDAEKFEDQLKAKLEELYREETRKTYVKQTKNVAEERLILLEKIKFAEKLQESNKELEIKLDTETGEIYFEGPQLQFIEAMMKFHKLDMDMVEKNLSVSKSILEVLGSDEGLQRVKCELEENDVEAVFVIDNEARIVGTSAAHADKAASLVSKLTLEEKVRVDEKSQNLLKTAEWRQLCDEINKGEVIRVYRNNCSDTFVAGFREDVTQAMKKLNAYLENNCIQTERFSCPSELVRRYLSEFCQDDLRSIETQLANFEVKVQNGRSDEDLVISGSKEGLKRTRKMLSALLDGTVSEMLDVKQPGLRKYFTSGKGDRLVKSVEKDHACAIHVERSFDKKQEGMRTRDTGAAVESDATSGDDDDEHYADGRGSDDDEQEEEAVVHSSNPTTVVTKNGHKISWRPGYIEAERADILVSSQGACSRAIITAGGQAMRQNFVSHPNTGAITVTPGSGTLACNHVIHTNCCKWNGGIGETVLRNIVLKCLQKGEELGGTSIAFPVIGSGNLQFPLNEASRIILDEAFAFCRSNPSSTVKDIRFVVHQQDQALIAAFGQEIASVQSQHKLLSSRFGRNIPVHQAGPLSIEVLQGDLCLETTDAIVNINSKDMNMERAGRLSKAVKQASGVQDECNRLGQQAGGSVVTTSSGNLATRGVRHIIHLIPESADKNHLQQCVEKCLRHAESRGIKSISFPAVGTGAYGMSATDSASLIFQALSNFSANFNTIRKVRIVVFQAQMLPAFQQEQQRHPILSNQGVAWPHVSKSTDLSIEVINGDLTQETTDAIMNINSTDLDMNKAGVLSKAILAVGGAQIQQECSQLGQQTPGSAVITSGGNLAVPHVIHIIPGSADKQHLQTCLEAGLGLADTHNLRSVSIPSVGTGGFGLAAADSAQLTFQALNSFSGNCKSVRKVRVVVFQASMMQEFLQAQQGQPAVVQDVDERGRDSSSDQAVARQPRKRRSDVNVTNEQSVKISVTGKDHASVKKAVDSLKRGFSEACTTQAVENETVSQLSKGQINTLRKKAKDRDVSLKIEADVDRVVVRGDPTEVTGMVGEIWCEINERNKKIQEKQQALLVSKNIEWSCEIHGTKTVFGPQTNAKIEMAYSKEQATVQIRLRADEFVIDVNAKTGQGRRNRERITLSRKVKGVGEGISLPQHWAPMPPSEKTVHRVPLASSSSEYQDVLRKMQTTTSGMQLRIQKIERIQNPHLYQSYMVRKQKMDKDYGGNSERQLFHGTAGKNVNHINTQGFNRSFCGAHGTKYGRGVYFARDASYSVGYAGGGGGARYMYLARVLVGRYCRGHPSMIVPPPKDPFRPEILHDSVVDHLGNPSIFVVFFDNQCYPEYLITF